MIFKFSREPARVVWIGAEENAASRTLVLATPNAFAIAVHHDSFQADFLGCHFGSVRWPTAIVKQPGNLPLTDKSWRRIRHASWVEAGIDKARENLFSYLTIAKIRHCNPTGNQKKEKI